MKYWINWTTKYMYNPLYTSMLPMGGIRLRNFSQMKRRMRYKQGYNSILLQMTRNNLWAHDVHQRTNSNHTSTIITQFMSSIELQIFISVHGLYFPYVIYIIYTFVDNIQTSKSRPIHKHDLSLTTVYYLMLCQKKLKQQLARVRVISVSSSFKSP